MHEQAWQALGMQRDPFPKKLPLTQLAKGQNGAWELQIRAWRSYDHASGLTVDLPSLPDAAAFLLEVLPEPNVQLSPTPVEELPGLEKIPPPIGVGAPSNEALHYRQKNGQPSVFIARTQIRQQAVSVGVRSRLKFLPGRVQVAQNLQYLIDYEPLESLVLEAPREALQRGVFTLKNNSQLLQFSDISPDPSQDPALIRVNLQGKQIGAYALELSYDLETPLLESLQEKLYSLRLAFPAAEFSPSAPLILHNLLEAPSLQTPQAALVESPQKPSPWRVDDSLQIGFPENGGEQWLRADGAVRTVALRLRNDDPPTSENTLTVSKAWMQSWLSENDRRDRAVRHGAELGVLDRRGDEMAQYGQHGGAELHDADGI